MSFWNQTIERFVEGLATQEELSGLLMRIDLPEEGRQAIDAALLMVNGLDQIHCFPDPSAHALPRLLDALRSLPVPEGIEFFVAPPIAAAALGTATADLPETDSESEAEEFRQLAAALDSFHGSIPFPLGAKQRLLDRLGYASDSSGDEPADQPRDVRAAFDIGGAPIDDENDDNVPYRGYFTGSDTTPDVLAASRETPPPKSPESADPKNDEPDPQNPG